MKRLFVVLAAVSVLSLSGCGFALRGTNPELQVAPAYQTAKITLADDQTAIALKRPLAEKLAQMGVQVGDSKQHIQVNNLQFRRYELIGTLTEVRLVLMANVSLTLDGVTTVVPMQVEQSYQYNEASVITIDQQTEIKAWLYQELAGRIAEYYRTRTINHG